jgi:aspartate/methionine/tyrosine aminotransferase
MSTTAHEARELFRLKPIRAAKVSEISEATAASSTPSDERVNFHIGNPVQEQRLVQAFVRAAAGLDIREDALTTEDPDAMLERLGWDTEDRPLLEFLERLVRASGPYLPRGGFARSSPPPLARTVAGWFQTQQEPLSYDLGASGGRREIIFASGGSIEALRVLLHALGRYLVHGPALVAAYGITLPAHLRAIAGINVTDLPAVEEQAIHELRSVLEADGGRPVFVLLGSVPSEHARRILRSLSLSHPLFFLEANDAPNHLSLSREAKLSERVIRFLSPGVLDARASDASLVFVAGNAEYLSLLETIHFQLKGTPSASEVELLTFLLSVPDARRPDDRPLDVTPEMTPAAPREAAGHGLAVEETVARHARSVEAALAGATGRFESRLSRLTDRVATRAEFEGARIGRTGALRRVDPFGTMTAAEVLVSLLERSGDASWTEAIRDSFLQAFVAHHPEYRAETCAVVSGSSRTALGILGYHCGVTSAVTPDLSWTYEHCFPAVTAVPLRPDLSLDPDAMIAAVAARLEADPDWRESGAVVLNNPHNATGRIFDEGGVALLVEWLLVRGVRVIDDLSYQNVAPVDGLPGIPTIRQTAERLVGEGRITSEQAARVITVHSMSKTDCLAGARLSVVEIRDPALRDRFASVNGTIRPNTGALLLTYLFYRNSLEVAHSYWTLRNRILSERMDAIRGSVEQLPPQRNTYGIEIIPPTGSMYPLLRIRNLPAGLSLEWVASGLARQGIGMIPLSTFARTEDGYETGRVAFRLTLGGSDGAEILRAKTRRVVIDLNRLLAEEQAQYARRRLAPRPAHRSDRRDESVRLDRLDAALREAVSGFARTARSWQGGELRDAPTRERFEGFVAERMAGLRRRYEDRSALYADVLAGARHDGGAGLAAGLERELYRDSIDRRQAAFRGRHFDRTVHPTQAYSIRTEVAFHALHERLLSGEEPAATEVRTAARELVGEFLGTNVAITSTEEAGEVLLDLDAHIAAEVLGAASGGSFGHTFLSFWGDWDGSTRPSGQGHRLVASVLMENVTRLARVLGRLAAVDRSARIPADLLREVAHLPEGRRDFVRLLDEITGLTHQLERRYRGVLPFRATPGPLRRIGMALHVARDPVTSLWYHNDRLERRMLELRRRRRDALERYFALNKRIRKELHAHIPALISHLSDPALALEVVRYRDLLQRFVLTPRIHEGMITAQDPFAIDTTVFNLGEINEVAARFGNPGMILALQVSMSTKPEALIALDQKMRARRESILRDHPDAQLPSVFLVPLFEGPEAVRSIPAYVEKLWEYSLQSRRISQDTPDRFAEIVCEIFIAGSDLSQAVGQPAGSHLFRQAKFELMTWLAHHGLAGNVRLKLGSGEPMQRQGGYYNRQSGQPAFLPGSAASSRFTEELRASTRRATKYATTPLLGILSGGDLRTVQSNLAEELRNLPPAEVADVLHHIAGAQHRHRRDLIRACEELAESRLTRTTRGTQALERLSVGSRDEVYLEFLKAATENFRQILYGRDEDVTGIHMISYFVARTTPPLRDRPTVRPSQAGKEIGNRILERIAETIPLSRYGSLLRAIAHNQAQTAVLGVNQLTTGLFRALDIFSRDRTTEGDPQTFLADRILPHLPVYEILNSLRLYQDEHLRHFHALERAFPAGNSAFVALREDVDAMARLIPLFQQELLRRHGIDVLDFFTNAGFKARLLPAIRPDLAVLLQTDIFNTDWSRIEADAGDPLDSSWKTSVQGMLRAAEEIRRWRARAWELLEQPVRQRVMSFADLASSLYSIASRAGSAEIASPVQDVKLSPVVAHFLSGGRADDEMRQFLAAAVGYLTAASAGMVDVPTNIVRALKEVERIAEIEDQALMPEQQEQLRFYLLQIARLAGDNG